MIWTRLINPENIISTHYITASELLPHTHSNLKVPKCEIDEFDNQGFSNELDWFLSACYARKYPKELNLPNDWHFNDEKYEAKRLEEVEALEIDTFFFLIEL